MTIMVSKLATTFLWRNMIESMSFLLSYFFFYYLPTTPCLVSLFCWMPTTATKAIMFHSNSIFCLFKRKSNFFSAKNISIEVFAKYLSRLIIYFILGINHNNIFCAYLIKYFADDLWVAWVNKDKLGNSFFFWKKYLSNFLSIYCAKRSDSKFWIIFEL